MESLRNNSEIMRVRKVIKHIWLSAILIITSQNASFAQRSIENEEIRCAIGVNVPMYKNVESDLLASVCYGYYYPSGVGFSMGVQYSPSVSDVNDYFGIPLAFTFRTRSRNTDQRVESAVGEAFESAAYGTDDYMKYGIASFLMNMFDKIEIFAGLTPGYIAGGSSEPSESIWGEGYDYWKKTWTERRHKVALSVDVGININYNIWRFDLKLMPSFHYNLTNNYIFYKEFTNKSTGEVVTSIKPLRFFFTFGGGVAFRF